MRPPYVYEMGMLGLRDERPSCGMQNAPHIATGLFFFRPGRVLMRGRFDNAGAQC